MPSRILSALARAARAGASPETLAPYAHAAKAVFANIARGRTRAGTRVGTRVFAPPFLVAESPSQRAGTAHVRVPTRGRLDALLADQRVPAVKARARFRLGFGVRLGFFR